MVLLVEPDPLVGATLWRELRREYEVVWVPSPGEAITWLASGEVAVVVAAWDFGEGRKGEDLLGQVAAHWPGVRRVLCSGIPGVVPASRYAQGLVRKHADVEDYRAAIEGPARASACSE